MTLPHLISLSHQSPGSTPLPCDRELEPHISECLSFYHSPLTTIEHHFNHFYPIIPPDPVSVSPVETISSSVNKHSFEFEPDDGTPMNSITSPPCTEYFLSLSDPGFTYDPAPYISPQPSTVPPLSAHVYRNYLLELDNLYSSPTCHVSAEPIMGQLVLYDSKTQSICSEHFDFDFFSNKSTPSSFPFPLPGYVSPLPQVPVRRVLFPTIVNSDPSRYIILLTLFRVLSGDSRSFDAYKELIEGDSSNISELYRNSCSITGNFREILGHSLIHLPSTTSLSTLNQEFERASPLFYVTNNLSSFTDLSVDDLDGFYTGLIDHLLHFSSPELIKSKARFRIIDSGLFVKYGIWQIDESKINHFDCMQRKFQSNHESVIKLGKEPTQPARLLSPLGKSWPVSVFTSFVHFLEIKFNSLNIEGIHSSNSARNIAVKISLRSSDTLEQSSILRNIWFNNLLTTEAISPVHYHSKCHPFQFFVKIFLPLNLTPSHHLFIELYHVSCKNLGRNIAKSAPILESGDPVAFGFLPLYLNTCLIDSGPASIELYETPVIPGYLSYTVKNHLKQSFSQRLLRSPFKDLLGLNLTLNVKSSLYPSDSAINILMRTAAMIFTSSQRVLRIGALVSSSDTSAVVQFFPILLNILGRALNSSRNDMATQMISGNFEPPKVNFSPSREKIISQPRPGKNPEGPPTTGTTLRGFSTTISEELFISILRVVSSVAVVENGAQLLQSFLHRHFTEDSDKFSSVSPVKIYLSLTSEWSKLLARDESTFDYSEPALLSLHLAPFLLNLISKSTSLAFLSGRSLSNISAIKSLIARLGISSRHFAKSFPSLSKSLSACTAAFVIELLPCIPVQVTDISKIFLKFFEKPLAGTLLPTSISTSSLKSVFLKTLTDSFLFFYTFDENRVKEILNMNSIGFHGTITELLREIQSLFPLVSLFMSELCVKIDCSEGDHVTSFLDLLITHLIQTTCTIENNATLSQFQRDSAALALSPLLLIIFDCDLYQSHQPLSISLIFLISWVFYFIPSKLFTTILENINHTAVLNLLKVIKLYSSSFSIDVCTRIISSRQFSEKSAESKALDFAKAISANYALGSTAKRFEQRKQLHSFSKSSVSPSFSRPFTTTTTNNSASFSEGIPEVTPVTRARSRSITSYSNISTALASTSVNSRKLATSDGLFSTFDAFSSRKLSHKSHRSFTRTVKNDSHHSTVDCDSNEPVYDSWYGGYLSQNICGLYIKILDVISTTVSSEKTFPKPEKSARKSQVSVALFDVVLDFLNLNLSELTHLRLLSLLKTIPFRHSAVIFEHENKLESLLIHLIRFMNYRTLLLQRSSMETAAAYLEVGYVLSKFNMVKRLLCKSLSNALNDPDTQIQSNLIGLLDEMVEQSIKSTKLVEPTVRLLKSIISDTSTLKHVQQSGKADLFTESDLLYRLSISLSDSVDLELSRLEQLANFHVRNQFYSSACLVFIKLAILIKPSFISHSVIPQLDKLASMVQLAGIAAPFSCTDFLNPQLVKSLDDEQLRVTLQFLDYIDKATVQATASCLGPLIHTLFPLRIYLYSYLKPLSLSEVVSGWKLALDEASKSTRLNAFYLIRFKGSKANEFDNKNYVYMFAPHTKIPTVTSTLQQAFSAPVVVRSGHQLTAKSEFDGETVYAFVTEVFPCGRSDKASANLVASDCTDLGSVCFKSFEFQYPFTKDGTKVSVAEPNQLYIRITTLTTSSYFPAARLRLAVESFTEREICPVGCAVQGLLERINKIESASIIDPMLLQMNLQGVIAPQVNAGPAHIYKSFFERWTGDSGVSLDPLRKAFSDLLSVCATALQVNWNNLEGLKAQERSQSELFHGSLEDGWFKLHDLIAENCNYRGIAYQRKVLQSSL
ncbi:hypothetical protein RCL1_001299 [Eukaryota sp. TZLM3-RCL]